MDRAKQRYDEPVTDIFLFGKSQDLSLLQLLDSDGVLDTSIPDAFGVYSPLLLASMYQLVAQYETKMKTKLDLLHDYIHGLLYLHDPDWGHTS